MDLNHNFIFEVIIGDFQYLMKNQMIKFIQKRQVFKEKKFLN